MGLTAPASAAVTSSQRDSGSVCLSNECRFGDLPFFSTLCLLFSDLFLTFAYVKEDNIYTYSLAFEILVILIHLDLIEKELFRRAPFPSSAAAVMRSL